MDQSSCGIDHCTRTDNDQHITSGSGQFGLRPGIHRQRFTKPGHGRSKARCSATGTGSVQRRIVHVDPLRVSTIGMASIRSDVAVQPDDVPTSGSIEEIVRVLGDLDDVGSGGETLMCSVGRGFCHLASSGRVPPHDKIRILLETIRRSEFHRVISTPPTVSRVPEGPDSRWRAQASAREAACGSTVSNHIRGMPDSISCVVHLQLRR